MIILMLIVLPIVVGVFLEIVFNLDERLNNEDSM